MSKKTITSNFIFSLINQLLAVILPLITGPYVARVLGAVGNGQYSYASSVAQYFVVFASLGFISYGQREIAKVNNDINERSKLFWELVLARLVPTLFSFFVYLLLGFYNLLNISDWLLMLVVSFNILGVSLDISFFFQGMEEFKIITIRTIIVRIISIIMIFTLVKSANDIWLYALCIAVSTVGSNIFMWLNLRKYLTKVSFKQLKIKRHIKPVLLLFLPNVAITLYTVLDKTMINLLTQGTQDFKDYNNGCYEQAYKINSIALVFVTVISPIYQSRNSNLLQNNDVEAFNRNINVAENYVWHISLPLVAGFIVLSSNLTSWFFGEGYDDVPILMIIMSFRFIFSGFYEIFGSQILLVKGMEKYISISTWIAAITNVILNCILIYFTGAIGAAIATAVCELANCLFVLYICCKRHFISLQMLFKKAIKPMIATLIMFGVIFAIQYFWDYSILSFIIITLTGVFVYGIILLILKDDFAFFALNKGLGILKKIFKKN